MEGEQYNEMLTPRNEAAAQNMERVEEEEQNEEELVGNEEAVGQ